ncbi:MAG: hypothetical protein QNJ47_14845 [Nostocaceae cyanobacterium]|nr:hypothetical protein [Nostocaceae cyanobacterium]
MMQLFLDKVGDWNPQLFREMKGRLKPRNILLAIAISLLGQFIFWMSFQTQLPVPPEPGSAIFNISNKYCTGTIRYGEPKCLLDNFGNVIIDWQLWNLDLFTWLSIIGSFAILVAGTYLLISDLATEERRDTLNFIRLTPQSARGILVGKILGVPILLYLATALTIPMHLWSGLAAGISLISILEFYLVLLAACTFYYSAALLFSFVGSWLSGFQAWLGSGVVLGFLLLTKQLLTYDFHKYPLAFLTLFNPFYSIPNFTETATFRNVANWEVLHWFSLPLGGYYFTAIAFVICNYAILNSFIWLALERCFRDPNATMLSKRQSYLLTSYFAIVTLGFANKTGLDDNLGCLLFLDFWLFLYLIAALSPHRQALQDWARYRPVSKQRSFWNSSTIKDLIWGEKSPAVEAIAINAIIAITFLIILVIFANDDAKHKMEAFFALALSGSLIMIYAALTQLILFMKTRHRVFWAIGSLGAVLVLPPIILSILFSYPEKQTFFWLFSVLAPLFALSPSSGTIYSITVFMAILGQWTITGLLMSQLRGKLQKAGESETKALMTAGVKN